VAANPRSKLIHKVMTLGKKVANERAFRERQRFGELLAGPSLEHSREQHPLADFRIAEVLHQSEVVKVSLHSAANARGLTDVQGLKVTPKAPSKYVHARPVGHLSEAELRKLVLESRAHELRLEIIRFNEAADKFLKWADGEHGDHENTPKRLRTSFASLLRFFGSKPVPSIIEGPINDYMAGGGWSIRSKRSGFGTTFTL